MKLLVFILVIGFLIILPIYGIRKNISVFNIYFNGIECRNIIVDKTNIDYRRRADYFVYVISNEKKIEIKVPYRICKNSKIGDSIAYNFIDGHNYGVYTDWYYPVSNFLASIIVFFVGLVFSTRLMLKSSKKASSGKLLT